VSDVVLRVKVGAPTGTTDGDIDLPEDGGDVSLEIRQRHGHDAVAAQWGIALMDLGAGRPAPTWSKPPSNVEIWRAPIGRPPSRLA
jgi:hypothetical protein